MGNKFYKSPNLEVIKVEAEGVICSSAPANGNVSDFTSSAGHLA